jgi:hypothetical protein
MIQPTFAVYSGRDRLGSYWRTSDSMFEAFDRLGRSLGRFPTIQAALDAIDKVRAEAK